VPNQFDLKDFPLSDIRAELHARTKSKAKGLKDAAAPAVSSPLQSVPTGELAANLVAEEKVIYGVDDRKDFFEFKSNAKVLNLANSVAALFRDNRVTDNGDNTSSLTTQPLGQAQNLCAQERFVDQPIGAFCSGFLVAPDLIATAGHCVTASNVTSIRFVFGFRMEDATTSVTRIPNGDIYSGKALIGRIEENSGPDWALVQLDRPVTGRPVLKIRRSGSIANNAPVSVIGHPSGLPIKFADDANVRDNTPNAFFVANLDTYGGNSGSPVFGADGTVEGILVRGEADYVSNGSCNISKVCPSTGCRGEDCTRITELADKIPTP
jgi:hypothetical protein